ncbi:MAG: chitobiase/beta-hexosaminidase C-terminal domain-containing protein [Hespellia sp.]|nr:chitobiase/beta-hexosaminidase C-terminal domain-containing protein [Hespellia sp.]
MKCMHCGADVPEGMLYCGKCGTEVQIVPDYNPLDDVLAKQVKGSIGGTTTPLDIYEESSKNVGKNRSTERHSNTGSSPKAHAKRQVDPRVKRRQQMERKRQLAKKRRQRRMIIFAFILVITGVFAFLIYQNSYSGVVRKGNRALAAQDYALAETYFNKAVGKNRTKAEAYTGLSKVYIAQDDLDTAEAFFLDAIDSQPTNIALYKGAIAFYTDTEQLHKITELLDGCEEDAVLLALSDYLTAEPDFSLEGGTYEDVQQVSLTSSGEGIYYTTDGSEPTTESTEYTEPILLNEGTTDLKAISLNKKGIPSVTAERKYIVEIPVADAPAVTPSTGQYDTDTQISIIVPSGYEAYYTLDGSDPTNASIKYSEPIDMPEGQTIFCAVLIGTNSGKASAVTKRNYVLEYE